MTSEESSLLVQEYYKSDQYNTVVSEDFTVSVSQGNTLCGDTITVYLTIEDDIIIDYSYSGEPAQITKAAAEFL
jgi:NifU-like protein involved in Fe-S cluster formation